jgi:hypothetical protein
MLGAWAGDPLPRGDGGAPRAARAAATGRRFEGRLQSSEGEANPSLLNLPVRSPPWARLRVAIS